MRLLLVEGLLSLGARQAFLAEERRVGGARSTMFRSLMGFLVSGPASRRTASGRPRATPDVAPGQVASVLKSSSARVAVKS